MEVRVGWAGYTQGYASGTPPDRCLRRADGIGRREGDVDAQAQAMAAVVAGATRAESLEGLDQAVDVSGRDDRPGGSHRQGGAPAAGDAAAGDAAARRRRQIIGARERRSGLGRTSVTGQAVTWCDGLGRLTMGFLVICWGPRLAQLRGLSPYPGGARWASFSLVLADSPYTPVSE